jgi:arginase
MTDRRLAIIGAALDLGAGRRGVDMGPSAIRYAGLDDRLGALGFAVFDLGNVEVAVAEAASEGDPQARFLADIKDACAGIAGLVHQAAEGGSIPIVLGGDHSVAVGTLGGLAALSEPGGVLWFDAHGDLNTPETSPSGNVHGMPLAAALGLANETFASDAWPLPALAPEHVALLGLRSLDAGERELVKELGIAAYTMSDFDRRGVEAVVQEAIERVAGAAFIHVSLDMDVVDPEAAPGVGTPVRGGLSYREAHLAMELVAEGCDFGSIEIVEVNPILDRENATGRLAVELAASAFGERIL